MSHTGSGNAKLAAVIAETGLSHAQIARAFVRVALEGGAHEFAGVGRSHVSHWVRGSKPSGDAPLIFSGDRTGISRRCLGVSVRRAYPAARE
jgi:hypothetical protein